MKKIFLISQLIFILMLFSIPISAKSVGSESLSVTRLNDLTNRFNSLESTWGRFQIGGNLSLESNSYLNQDIHETMPTANFGQHLNLYLDAFIERNLMLSLKMVHHGGWGLNYQSTGSSNYPMTTPVEIDEAFIRFEQPNSLNYIGRFRFSTSPVGLISDFYNNPVEGLALQRSFQNYHMIGIYSRVNTEYQPGTDQVTAAENYYAARLGWSDEYTVIGLNLVPNGITGEKAVSLDGAFSLGDAKLSAELGWYQFETDKYPDYQVDWTPGVLVSYGKNLSKSAYFQVKAAYISPQFTPSFSSLAHSSGVNREWFLPNSKGIELFLQNQLSPSISLENRLITQTPIENYDQASHNSHWRSSLFKSFSPLNRLEIGIDIEKGQTEANQVYLRWNLSF